MKKISIALCLLFLVSILLGCESQIDNSWEPGDETVGPIRGSQRIGSECDVSVHEKGAFYISSSGLLSYYDYDADDNYILCSAPNCGHNSAECAANAGSLATGFGLYGDCGYYLRPSQDTAQWEFVCVDIETQTSQVLCAIGGDGSEINQWWCIGVEEVFYNNGYAWLDMTMYYSAAAEEEADNATQLFAIDLENGDMTEITPPLSGKQGYGNTRWEFFNEDYACVYMLYYKETYLSMDAYKGQNGGATDADYLDYLDRFFAEHSEYLRHILIDINTMEQIVIREIVYDHAERLAWMDEDVPVFWISESLDDGKTNTWFQSVDPDGALTEQGFFTGNGLTGWYAGGILTKYDGDSYLYEIESDPSTCQMWRYHISSRESSYLFDFSNKDRFDLFGQTEDKLVGMLDGNTRYAWIYKSDYEQGNFDALHEFSIG